MVAAAVIGGAVASAGIGAIGSASAAGSAANATNNATNASIAEQNAALQQQATLSAPYRALGQGAIPTLQGLLGIGGQPATGASGGAGGLTGPNASGPGAAAATSSSTSGTGAQNTAQIEQTLQNMPGYQFTQQQGTQNTVNQAAAMGLGLSGNTLEGLSQFNTGLADQTYQQQIGNLENTVNTGQAAAAGQAANIGNAAGNISSSLTSQGNNLAGIYSNEIAGITKAAGNGINQGIGAYTLAGLGNPSDGIPDIAAGSGAGSAGNVAGGMFWPS